MIKVDFIGENRLHFGSVNSTNDYLKEHHYLPSGTVVTADYQTAGRGTKTNVWESARFQNVLMSVILKPDSLVSDIVKLVKVTSVAIHETLKNFGVNSKIKWPNDIMVNNKKIAGILVESSVTKNKVDYVILGMGVNVNQVYFRHLTDVATSIKKELKEIQKEHVQEFLIEQLNKFYLEFLKGDRGYLEIYNRVKYENE